MKMLIGIAASLLVIKIVKNLIWGQIVYEKLGWLGRHSLEIYVVQSFGLTLVTKQLDVSNIRPIFLFFLLMGVSILLSVVIVESSKLLSNIPFVGLLLFGKKRNKE